MIRTIKLGTINPVSLSDTARNRIASIGIELEGGWDSLPDGTGPEHDGSVKFGPTPQETQQALNRLYQEWITNASRGGTRSVTTAEGEQAYTKIVADYRKSVPKSPEIVGELPSPILTLDEKSSKTGKGIYWETWMKKFYPHHVNSTCGLHVHFGFGDNILRYQRLMVPEFPRTIIEEVLKWAAKKQFPQDHPIWPRLNGSSEYCQHVFSADTQAAKKRKEYDHHAAGNRYAVVNYCFGLHETLEIRLLPMFAEVTTGIEAVSLLIDLTNRFLGCNKRKEKVTKINSTFEGIVPTIKEYHADL